MLFCAEAVQLRPVFSFIVYIILLICLLRKWWSHCLRFDWRDATERRLFGTQCKAFKRLISVHPASCRPKLLQAHKKIKLTEPTLEARLVPSYSVVRKTEECTVRLCFNILREMNKRPSLKYRNPCSVEDWSRLCSHFTAFHENFRNFSESIWFVSFALEMCLGNE